MSVMQVKRDGEETWKQKLVRRFKEEPFVPIGTSLPSAYCIYSPERCYNVGTALTCFALIMASRKAGRKGESKSLNRWFRARIVFQGATIAAIVVGSYAVQKKKHGADDDSGAPQETASAEELRLKERAEFEARLRKAEETHAYEQAMRGGKPKEKEKSIFAKLGLGRGPAGGVEAESHGAPLATSASAPPVSSTPAAPAPAVPAVEPSQPSGKSWWGWGGKSSS